MIRLLFTFAFLVSTVVFTGALHADVSVEVSGPAGKRTQSIAGDSGTFDLNVPLASNSVNSITVTATDDQGNSASKKVEITQVSLTELVVAEVTAKPLSISEIEQLVQDGTIDLDDPTNFNVSIFNIVLSIAQKPIPISIPIAVSKAEEPPIGFEQVKVKGGDGPGAGKPQDVEIIIFEVQPPSPPGVTIPSIPGVIVIEGRIKTLKEFFSANFLIMNTSGIFTLKDVSAEIRFPDGGLSSTLPKNGMAFLGDVLPGGTGGPGQLTQEFIIRGDEKGNRGIAIDFAGSVAGPGIAEEDEIPFSGSATTSIEVKGPPEFLVEVTQPAEVTAGVAYELAIDITNIGDTPALYASLELDVGVDAELLNCFVTEAGEPQCELEEGSIEQTLGHILSGETRRTVFNVLPKVTGPIASCIGLADQNIALKVNVGDIGCLVGQRPPAKKEGDPTPGIAVVPFNNALGVNIDSPVVLFFSSLMNESTIRTGIGESFNVYDGSGLIVPGRLRFDTLNDNTVVVWQVNDGVTNRLKENNNYSIEVLSDISDVDGNKLSSDWTGTFQTTGQGIDDITPPEVSMIVLPGVDPSAVVPGQVAKVRVFPVDQGSGISRVQMRLKDLTTEGAKTELIDEKRTSPGNLPPFNFAIDTRDLIPGNTYELRATAYDGVSNTQDTTLALFLVTDAPFPTISLPDDTDFELLQGARLDIAPEGVTGGVVEVRYFIDGVAAPVVSENLPPYLACIPTLGLEPGARVLTAEVEDGLGQVSTSTFNFELLENTNAPIVSFSTPFAGSKQLRTGDPFLVSLEINDVVESDRIEFFLNDTETPPVVVGPSEFLFNPGLLPVGSYQLFAKVTNRLGIANDPLLTALQFEILDVIPGPQPDAPVILSISPPENGQSTVTGVSTVASGRIDIVSAAGITQTIFADSTGNWMSDFLGAPGDTFSVVAYDLSQTVPSAETLAVVPDEVQLVSLTASPLSLTFGAEGESQALSISALFSDSSLSDVTNAVNYRSTKTGVVTVSPAGVAFVQGNGSAEIIASLNGIETRVPVDSTVLDVVSVQVSPSSIEFSAVGETVSLQITEVLSDSSTRPAGNPTLASNSIGSFTANSAGVVTAIDNGSGSVTVGIAGKDVQPVVIPVSVSLENDTAPTVSFISPASGSSVERGDTVVVQVRGVDAVGGISSIRLNVSGETIASDTVQISPTSADETVQFSFIVDTAANIGGVIALETFATDSSNQNSATLSRSLIVADQTAPTLSFLQPQPETEFETGDVVNLIVEAVDSVGVSKIEFNASGGLAVAGDNTFVPAPGAVQASFNFTVPSGVSNPDVNIFATAFDASGNTRTAGPLQIKLSNADLDPPVTEATGASVNGVLVDVDYSITDGTDDLSHVELYFRRNGIGTYNRYTDALGGNQEGQFFPQSGDSGTITFDSTRMGGAGDYEFFTVGVDVLENRELVPESLAADVSAIVVSGQPVTLIDVDTTIDDGSFDDRNILIDGVDVLIVGTRSFRNVELINGATLTHEQGAEAGVDVTAWTFTVDAASSIDVDSKGYAGGLNSGNSDCSGITLGGALGSTTVSAGSYGGPGEEVSGVANDTYGSLVLPNELGSGGSCAFGRFGGNGGGKVKINTINIVVDGDITASGGIGNGFGAGSGSGGSISFATSTLSGDGKFEANGGGGETAGGGGRVSISYVDIYTLNTGLVEAVTGASSGADGGDGTVFFRALTETNGSLVVDGQGAVGNFTTLPIPPGFVFDNITIQNSARVLLDGEISVSGAFEVLNNSIVSHTLGMEEGLQINAKTIFVDSNSAIDVSGKGYLGGLNSGNESCSGFTLGNVLGVVTTAGGSYGGYGETVSGQAGQLYGIPSEPVYLGSGGTCVSGRFGGNGGGRVQLVAEDSVEVDGSVLANGQVGNGFRAGSGSGGSVLIETSLFKGLGEVRANGGGSETSGGGGRVYVEYDLLGGVGDDFNSLSDISAFSGSSSGVDASAGTVLLKRTNQLAGDLYLDFGNISNSQTDSSLTPIGYQPSLALSADTITVSGEVRLLPGGLVGVDVNPNTLQSEVFEVISNTETTITVDISGGLSLTDVAEVGDEVSAVYSFDNVELGRTARVSLSDSLFVLDTLLVSDNSVLSHTDTTPTRVSRLELVVDTLSIEEGSSLDVSSKGFNGGLSGGNTDCFGLTTGNTPGSAGVVGGSYGGLGEARPGSVATPVYGDLTDPAQPGSGGSCVSGRAGGDGGGYVQINANRTIVDGEIIATGGVGSGFGAGSGSGGAINIRTAVISGTGSLQANGGGLETSGAGGRVAIRYSTLAFDVASIEAVSLNSSGFDGGNGTVFLKGTGQLLGDIIVDGASGGSGLVDGTVLPIGVSFDNAIFRNDANVLLLDELVVENKLELTGGAVVRHSQGNESGLKISAKLLEIDATSSIDVTGRGYRGGLRSGNILCEGETLGRLPGVAVRAGGSHGGVGGVLVATESAGDTYGNPYSPVTLGAGGTCASGRSGGNGGGLIVLDISESILLDGAILSGGTNGSGFGSGSGAGGSINISTVSITGSGQIAANGAGLETGGGGGRILVDVDTPVDPSLSILASSVNSVGFDASPGTVVLRVGAQQFGDLIIDADSVSTVSEFSRLPIIGFGESTALTDDTLTTSGDFSYIPNALVGVQLSPNTAQAERFTVVSNTEQTITVDISSGVSLTDVADVGDEYSAIYTFDNVYMRAGATLSLGDELDVLGELVLSGGSILSHLGATTSFESRVDVSAQSIDVQAGTQINVDGKGYLGGLVGSNASCSGRTLDNFLGSTSRSAGSYGGLGEILDGVPNPIYGDALDPRELGSGGSCASGRKGGNGGGSIQLDAVSVTIDGTLTADGLTGGGFAAGSGSGGSVNISTSAFSGTGNVFARGAGLETGGGGGRVAVTFDGNDFSGAVSAESINSSGNDGEDGTVNLIQR